jgi:biopolymer transport protein ExbB/TolQ
MNLNFLQSGLELLHRGGWVMIPLLLLSTISVAVMLERAWRCAKSLSITTSSWTTCAS